MMFWTDVVQRYDWISFCITRLFYQQIKVSSGNGDILFNTLLGYYYQQLELIWKIDSSLKMSIIVNILTNDEIFVITK